MNKNYTLTLTLLFLHTLTFGQQKAEVKDALTRIRYNFAEGEYKTALTNYDLLIKYDPKKESEYLYNKGLCYYYLKDDSASEVCFREGLTKMNTYAGNNLGIGLHLIQRDLDSSIYYSKQLVTLLKDSIYPTFRIEKDNSVSRRGLLSSAYQNIGMAYSLKGATDSALFYIELAMSLNPGKDDHLLACSYVYFKSNNFEKAYLYSKKALELNRHEIRSALLMALSLEKVNKIPKAINHLNDCIIMQNSALKFWTRGDGKVKTDLMNQSLTVGYKNMEEVSAEFYVLAAYLLYKNDKKEEAAVAYNQAVKLNHAVFYRIDNEIVFMEFMQEFITSKLGRPVSPKNYLPIYYNIFSRSIIN